MKFEKIPSIAISRLSVYARSLALLDQKGIEITSSGKLAKICSINPAQIRKDLSYFGEFGVRGVGYYVKELLFEIRKILGLEEEWRLALVGAGNLGQALIKHAPFTKQGYTFVAAFEKNAKRIGMQIGDVTIAPMDDMERLIKEKGAEIGVIAVNSQWAQRAADKLIGAGVRGILNFAPAQLHCPGDVCVENVDLSLKLDVLCYRLTSQA